MEKDAEGFYTPAPDSKPEVQAEQEDSAYLNSFGSFGVQPQIPTGELLIRHKSAIQRQISSSRRLMLLYVALSPSVCKVFFDGEAVDESL